MYRALIKILVGLVLAAGLSIGVASTPATAATATHAPVRAVAHTAARTGVCARQTRSFKAAQRKLHTASRTLKSLQHNHRVKHRAAKIRAAKHRVHTAKAHLNKSLHTLQKCKAKRHTSTKPPVTSSSPIQALCDAGVPQQVCDALAGLIPGGTSTTAVPIGQLCSQVPGAQPLCDALGNGIPDVSSLQSVLTTVLNTLGLGNLLSTIGLGDLTTVLGNLI